MIRDSKSMAEALTLELLQLFRKPYVSSPNSSTEWSPRAPIALNDGFLLTPPCDWSLSFLIFMQFPQPGHRLDYEIKQFHIKKTAYGVHRLG